MSKLKIKTFDRKFTWAALKIFLPIILAGIVQAGVGFIDNIAVSGSTIHDGVGYGMDKIDLKAVGAGNEIFFLATSFAMAFSVLFGVLYAQFAKKQQEFSEVFKLSIWFVTIVTTLTSVLLFIFAKQLIGLFFQLNVGPDKALVIKHGTNFVRIMALGDFFYSLAINMLSPLTIKGKVKYGLYLSLTSLLINISFDIWFIYGFKWGAEGSAWATVIAYFLEFILALYFLIKHHQWFKGALNIFIVHKKIFQETSKRFWLFAFFVLMQMSFAATTILWSAFYGSNYIAGITTGYIVANLMFVTFPATSKGVSIYVGPLLGANKMLEAKLMSQKLLWPNLIICLVTMALAGIVASFFPNLMLSNARDIGNAKWVIIVFIISLPAYLGVTFFSGMFEVGGKQIIPNVWNRGFPIWAQLSLIFLFSSLALNLNWEWAFLIVNTSTYFALLVIFGFYRRFKWLHQINVT